MPRIPKEILYYEKIKMLIGAPILFSIFIFPLYLGLSILADSFKERSDLAYTEGIVKEVYFVTRDRRQKFRLVSESTLVLKLEGTNQRFGVSETQDEYKKMIALSQFGKKATVYYEKPEFNDARIILNIWDLKVHDHHVIKMAAVKKDMRLRSFLFLAFAFVILIMIVSGIKSKIKERNRRSISSKNSYSNIMREFFSKAKM